MAFALVVAGCASTPKLAKFVICDCSLSKPPIKIFVSDERDLVGNYDHKLAFFGLKPLSAYIRSALEADSVSVLTWSSYDMSASWRPRLRPNPLIVVDDPKEADLFVKVGVDRFDFEEARSVGDRLLDAQFLGLFGIRSDAPCGIVGASCVVDIQSSPGDMNLKSIQFDILGVSDRKLAKNDAFDQALSNASKVFVYQLLRTKEGGLDNLNWTANKRTQQTAGG